MIHLYFVVNVKLSCNFNFGVPNEVSMKKNGKFIEFICKKCKTKEKIPTEIVEMLDASDSIGVDTDYPPRFNCEKCPGKMGPIYYISVHGKVHEYKEN